MSAISVPSKFRLGEFEVEQVATVVPSIDVAVNLMKKIGGSWVDDYVTLETKLTSDNVEGLSVYRLFFNYDMSVEYELLLPLSGPVWLERPIHDGGYASHLGTHVQTDAFIEGRSAARSLGVQVVQESKSLEHTNPALVESGRTYRYSIVGARDLLGFDLKFIQRVGKF
jgi:hypothetical protein